MTGFIVLQSAFNQRLKRMFLRIR